jgi:hypothetical protein
MHAAEHGSSGGTGRAGRFCPPRMVTGRLDGKTAPGGTGRPELTWIQLTESETDQ